MIKITYKVNGRTVSPNNLGNELMRAVTRDLDKQVSRRLGALRCPVHGQTARLTRSNSSVRGPKWQVSGCCDQIIEAAKRMLG